MHDYILVFSSILFFWIVATASSVIIVKYMISASLAMSTAITEAMFDSDLEEHILTAPDMQA